MMQSQIQIPRSIQKKDGRLIVLDQTRLPDEEIYLQVEDIAQACEIIERLAVRGAPAIGIFAAHALADHARRIAPQATADDFRAEVLAAAERLRRTRPTAVNLSVCLARMAGRLESALPPVELARVLESEAEGLEAEDRALCAALAEHAADLLPNGARVLTICHTGALATAGVGTALGAFHTAHARGNPIHVFACETRPLLQGARLTAWELMRAGVQVTLLTDSMAAHVIGDEGIQVIMVGADRIAQNGDTANKIGTHSLAILAKHFAIPFYVVAAHTTVDSGLPHGRDIPIEERRADEVRGFRGQQAAPREVPTRNPAFDLTPGELVSAIVTDSGIHRPPYDFS